MKVAVIGSGLRTPLLLHGLIHSDLTIEEVRLYDLEPRRSETMAQVGKAIAHGRDVAVQAASSFEEAVEGSSFVVSSIRPGGLAARAADERLALEHGFAGQETTGPAGFAMALRTVPVALEQARIVERLAPKARLINFTNPAGLVTQAINTHTSVQAVGICDTPAELFWRISLAADAPIEEIECDYVGLNHLGWVRGVRHRGREILGELLADEKRLASLYPAALFPTAQLRALRLLPTEYVYFYYSQERARSNQLAAGATRGEELVKLNEDVWTALETELGRDNAAGALDAYRSYLNRRNASYLRLEGAGESALEREDPGWDPFAAQTGYHRIAVEAIRAFVSATPMRMVLNVPNRGAIPQLEDEDVVEIHCLVDQHNAAPLRGGPLPAEVAGLVTAVKAFERITIEAVVGKSPHRATLALSMNPIVDDWAAAREFISALAAQDGALREWLDPRRDEMLAADDPGAYGKAMSKASSNEQLPLYAGVVEEATRRGVEFAVGGSLALAAYGGGLLRTPKDLDLYVKPESGQAMIDVLTSLSFSDYYDELPYDRGWIFRAVKNGVIVDCIWRMANGRTVVDDSWLRRGRRIEWAGNDLRLVSIEDLIWSKLYVLQRDRCDWPDIFNLLDAADGAVDWEYLYSRVGPDSQLLDAVVKSYSWLRPETPDLGETIDSKRIAAAAEKAVSSSETSRERAALLDPRPWLLAEHRTEDSL